MENILYVLKYNIVLLYMSLSVIQNRRQTTIFGKDLNVLIGDTTINGDLNILGNINGTSSQGQNTNNTWSGTNEYSVERPTCNVDATGADDGVVYTQLQAEVINNSVINSGGDFSGPNTFNQPIISNTLTPVGATDAISGSYLISSWSAKGQSYLGANNSWTGASNVFQNFIPTAIEPVASTDVATKNYTDTAVDGVAVGDSTTTASQISTNNINWGANYKAVEIQIIGGGGGSTSSVGTCVCSSAGVSGGSGSQASIILLTSSSLVGGSNLATYNVSVGNGGRAGTGCGTSSASGAGGATNLSYNPNPGQGFATTGIDINILRANGGGGFGGTCGQGGTTSGGTYTNINSKVSITPYSSSNGLGGRQCAGAIRQPYGYDTFGSGGAGRTCAGGQAGTAGGFITTFY